MFINNLLQLAVLVEQHRIAGSAASRLPESTTKHANQSEPMYTTNIDTCCDSCMASCTHILILACQQFGGLSDCIRSVPVLCFGGGVDPWVLGLLQHTTNTKLLKAVVASSSLAGCSHFLEAGREHSLGQREG